MQPIRTLPLRLLQVLVLAAGLATGVRAQPFDVPYVPTPQVVVDEMLTVAGVGPGDFVIDLGSGDGRIPITAVRNFGAKATGVDIDPGRIAESLQNVKAAGLDGKVEFVNMDLFKFDLTRATVITMYLLPRINLRLRPRLFEELKPGTRIVSHDFSMGDWKPDRLVSIQKNIFYWVIPARIAGKWKMDVELPIGERSYDIELTQRFQEVDGFAKGKARNHPFWEVKLAGSNLRFVLVDEDMGHHFDGEVKGDVIEGTVYSGAGAERTQAPFRMRRVAAGVVKLE